jgi:hypothetical protein
VIFFINFVLLSERYVTDGLVLADELLYLLLNIVTCFLGSSF